VCLASLRDITERKHAEEAARRLIHERAARSAAESASRRFRFLAESSHLLAASLDMQATIDALARLCVAELADWVMISVLRADGVLRRAAVVHRDAGRRDAARALHELPVAADGTDPVWEVLKSREPRLERCADDASLARLAPDPEQRERLRTLGTDSLMIVPLVARDQAIGAIALGSGNGARAFDAADLELARDLALRAALALDNARLFSAAQQANRAKSDFLAAISHDLRTPLNSIIGHADLLTLGIPDTLSAASQAHVDRIRTGAAHLLHLIDQLISHVRLEANREVVNLDDVDSASLVHEVCALLEPLARQRDLRLQPHVPGSTIMLRTDPDKLRQVLVNLVANAVKYTERGRIDVRVTAEADATVFSVRDSGVGIAPEHLPHIFEPFWQVDGTSRLRDGGTGLGLSLVQRITRLLGGAVTVDSQPGVGSAFHVRLPAAPPHGSGD
jgi:signal transduction histidine kinase